jgi:hypothetical protein
MDTRKIAVEYRLAHWADILQDRQSSGKSVRTYCRSTGICENVYYYWQRKLRAAACEKLLPTTDDPGSKALVPSGWAVCEAKQPELTETTVSIEIGKFRITAGSDTNTEQLEKVCRVLMSLC